MYEFIHCTKQSETLDELKGGTSQQMNLYHSTSYVVAAAHYMSLHLLCLALVCCYVLYDHAYIVEAWC